MKDSTLITLFKEICEVSFVLHKYPSIDIGYRLRLKMRHRILREQFGRYAKFKISMILHRQKIPESVELTDSEYFVLDYDGDPGYRPPDVVVKAIRKYEDDHGLPHSRREYVPGMYRNQAHKLALRTRQ